MKLLPGNEHSVVNRYGLKLYWLVVGITLALTVFWLQARQYRQGLFISAVFVINLLILLEKKYPAQKERFYFKCLQLLLFVATAIIFGFLVLLEYRRQNLGAALLMLFLCLVLVLAVVVQAKRMSPKKEGKERMTSADRF